MTSASHMSANSSPRFSTFLLNAPGKATGGDLNAWASARYMRDLDEVPGFWLCPGTVLVVAAIQINKYILKYSK